jgi:integrase
MKNGLYSLNGNWYMCVKIRGIRVRKSFGTNRYAAEVALSELKKWRALANATKDWSGLEEFLKPKSTITFAMAAEQYMAERADLKPSSIRSYQDILKNYLLPRFGESELSAITETDIANFQSDLLQKVSARRVNNVSGLLRFILKACTRRKLITENPALGVRTLREKPPEIDPFKADELTAIINALPVIYRPFFICQAWSGARPNELLALKWSDINFKRDEIYIRRGRVFGKEGTPKTSSSVRVIPMFPPVRQVLLELEETQTRHIKDYVFLSRSGEPIDTHLDRQWRFACKRASIRHRPSYQLRHTFASMCLTQGCDPGWLSRVLGHVSMQTLFKHYARFIDGAAKENEKRMKNFLLAADESIEISKPKMVVV